MYFPGHASPGSELKWKVIFVAKKQNKDAYRKLGRILIVLLVLLLLCGAGYVLLNRTIQMQEEENAAVAMEENARLQSQYEAAKAEEKQKEAQGESIQWPTPAAEGLDVVDLSEFPLNDSYTVTADRKELMLGGMMLLNRWHELPADFYTLAEPELVSVHTVDKNIPVSGSGVKLFPAAIGALGEMLADAKEDGLENFLIDEAYRTQQKQQEYYDAQAAKYADQYTGDVLRDKVVKDVSYPGTSEYQSGFAFRVDRYRRDDADFNKAKFNTTEHSDWLVKNSWKYGYIFRFPMQGYPNATVTDKSYKTGSHLKLMIYRYVGQGHAAVMHALDLCQEEYIEYLMQHPHIALYEDGQLKYEIVRVNANYASGASVEVSGACKGYTLAMDNMGSEYGGVIVCMEY